MSSFTDTISAEKINEHLRNGDFNGLMQYIDKETYDHTEKKFWLNYSIYQVVHSFDLDQGLAKKIAGQLYTVSDILSSDDVENLPKINDVKAAIAYFEEGGEKIKNYIIDNYPQFLIKNDYFQIAAQNGDFNLIKKIYSAYQGNKEINWLEIACIYIKYSEEDQIADFDLFFEFLSDKGINFANNVQRFLMVAIYAEVELSIQYFLDHGANINERWDDKLPIEIANNRLINNYLIRQGADTKLIN